jgi:hypothetical protein
MTAMTLLPASDRLRRTARALLAVLAVGCAVAAGGCGTSQPGLLTTAELSEAQTFPYFRVYWVGRSFDGRPLAAADGLKGYIEKVGDSVYYGDCVNSKGILGGGNCLLPLQVTTVIYALHSNKALGVQHNILVRGAPATVYDEGRAIEIYSGRVAIDIFSDTYAHALQASNELFPLNAPGSGAGELPPPVYCPGLYGPEATSLERVMANLPGHICQHAAQSVAYAKELSG